MISPTSHIDLKLKNISSIDELAEIAFGILLALEETFGLSRDWKQVTPPGIPSDDDGLSSLRIVGKHDLEKYFVDRDWGLRFSGMPDFATGIFYNETVIVQLNPEEFSINFEHFGATKSGEWNVTVNAPGRKLKRELFVECGDVIREQNKNRSGSICCSYKTSQKQIGKYIPAPLVEEVYVHNIGKKWL